jgi:hypothetical protein
LLLQTDKSSNYVFIVEGIETALSLKEAGVKGEIVASMGIYNMANYQGSKKEIIICADNDDHKPNSQTYKTIESTKNHFEFQKKSVAIINPKTPGDDFNDVLKKQGIPGIQEYVKPYLTPDQQAIQKLPISHETAVAQTAPLRTHPLEGTPKMRARKILCFP